MRPLPAAAWLALLFVTGIKAQCVSLSGSTTCPAFQDMFINPTNLSRAWPFFEDVTNVSTFDTQFAQYLSADGQYARTKIQTQLQCYGENPGLVLQYSQTFLCGEFTGISYSASCNRNVATPKMTCQSTCLEFSASERRLVSNSSLCGPTTTTREATIAKDAIDCTSWFTLQSNNTNTCVLGYVNEPNCGFRSSTSQLCSYCDPANSSNGLVSPCCAASGTDLSSCGFTLAASQVSSVSSASTSTGSSSASSSTRASSTASSTAAGLSSSAAAGSNAPDGVSANRASSGLSGGQIAGVVVGSVIGGLLLLGLLLFLLLCLRRRRRDRKESSHFMIEKRESPGQGSSPASGFSGYPHEKTSFDRQQSGNFTAGAVGLAGAGAAATGLGAAAYGSSNKNDMRRGSAGTYYSHRTSMTDTEGRMLVSEFNDLYSNAVITPGSVVEAIFPYNPALPDELRLSPGDLIEVENLYDDNWASGTVRTADGSSQLGAFPLVCVSAQVGSESATFSGSRSNPAGTRTQPSVAPSERSSSRDDFISATGGRTNPGTRSDAPDNADPHLFNSRVVFPSRPAEE